MRCARAGGTDHRGPGARRRLSWATLPALVGLLTALTLAGCGSSSSTSSASSAATSSASSSATTTSATSSAAATLRASTALLGAAERPRRATFPAARGRTLRQLLALAHGSLELSATTGNFTPGSDRFAFGLIDSAGGFTYAPTALYIAATPTARAQGPFLAPADPMGVAPQYRSAQNQGPDGIQAIYSTHLPLPRAGTYALLAVTRTAHGMVASPGEVAVAASSPIPNVGQRPPAIVTDTLATVHGDVALLTTRRPPEHMASVSFNQVLGRRPVALLFSTPQLCTSRVCGPVTDLTVSLQHEFGTRITFIHQEIYVDNDPAKGMRPQMTDFHLRTEPWLFAINRRGIIVARLEGAFGVNGLRAALEAALR